MGAERNARINGYDIDLLVHAERDGEKVTYIVEVKVKPDIRDVGGLLALAELYEVRRGERPVPVLAGVWIGTEVEAYAAKKDVVVFRL